VGLQHIAIMGEAARSVSPKLREAHPEVSCPPVVAMRNALAHDYFGLEVERVWNTVERDLPSLRRQVQVLIDELPDR
jgi:uncharacterized protein with HEPN domain